MGAPACSDEEFVSLFEKWGATKTAALLGISERVVYRRRRQIEGETGRLLVAPSIADERRLSAYPMRRYATIHDGTILVASDHHYEPGSEGSPAHRGMVKLTRALKPKKIIHNGDVGDFPDAGKHDRIGWSPSPKLHQEIDAIHIRLSELEDAAGPECDYFWNLGNHCLRYESYLANRAPAAEGLMGSRLGDVFPRYNFGTSLWVNDDVVIKHRYKGGVHATHQNVVNAGRTIITGHLHSLKVTPFDDYNGTRWGVDTGTLNAPDGQHTAYAEDNPQNHRSGFIVLTFHRGRLLWPEIAAVVDAQHIQFRGQLIEV